MCLVLPVIIALRQLEYSTISRRIYTSRSEEDEAYRLQAYIEGQEEYHWESFDTKFALLKIWVQTWKQWPNKSSSMSSECYNIPRTFHVGKWVINKTHYSHGFTKGRVLFERNESIKEQMRMIRELKLQLSYYCK